MKRIAVRYIHFPDTEDGRLGFYREPTDKSCLEPRYSYKHSENSWGYCHINNPEEMNKLATQIGAMTREEFITYRHNHGFKTWLNAYSKYLSSEIGKTLQKNGILLKIREEDVLFYCPEGQFVLWKGKAGLT